MAYTIELSFDICKNSSVGEFCHYQRSLAKQYNCEFQYFMNEIDGKGNKTTRSDCIQVVIFNEEQYQNFIDFLSVVYKQRSLYIECIYREDNSCNLLYISGRYLKRLDKNTAREVRRKYQKRQSETKDIYHDQILNILKNKNINNT